MHDLIANCELIARVAHHGQTRADNVTPYIVHPKGVAKTVWDGRRSLGLDKMEDYVTALCAAWLHDVVEDCYINTQRVTSHDLLAWGVSPEIVAQVMLLTKPDDAPARPEYYSGIAASKIAKAVKYADRLYNLRDAAVYATSGHERDRWKQYAIKTRRDVLPMYADCHFAPDSYMHDMLVLAIEELELATA